MNEFTQVEWTVLGSMQNWGSQARLRLPVGEGAEALGRVKARRDGAGDQHGKGASHGSPDALDCHCTVAWWNTLLSMAEQMPPLPGRGGVEPKRWLSKPGLRVS